MEINLEVDTLEIKAGIKRKPRKHWMDPLLFEKRLKGHFQILFEEIQTNKKHCLKSLGMPISAFNSLLEKVKPRITYTNTHMRLSISPEERLIITLKHLSTGTSFTSLHTEFLVGVSTVSKIVYGTCEAIWEALRVDYMPDQSREKWQDIADLFYKRTNFPNCLGAIAGKIFHLLKADCSVILLAVVDANYSFTAMDVIDSCGRYCDANIFHSSELAVKFRDGRIDLPSPSRLPGVVEGDAMPYMMVSDEAFSRSPCILRPFVSRKTDTKKQIFNYRCSRATRMADSAFGMLTSKWKILDEKLSPNPALATHLIKACLLLHNYVLKKNGVKFEDTLYSCNLDVLYNQDSIAGNGGYMFRNAFADYFASPTGAVTWQDEMILL